MAPISPEMNIRGTKTQVVVRKEEITPGMTSRTLRATESPPPPSRFFAMFSAITMLSSMMRPIAMRSATRLIMLIETPTIPITKTAAKNENGSAREIQTASRTVKKKHMTRITRARLTTAFPETSAMRSRTTVVVLLITVIRKGSENLARSRPRSVSTWSKASMASAVPVLLILRIAVLSPSTKARSSGVSSSSVTVARSERKTSPPVSFCRMTRFSRSEMVRRASEYLRKISRPSVRTVPMGTRSDRALISSETDFALIPKRRSAFWSREIRNSLSEIPVTSTDSTSSRAAMSFASPSA